jgi:hypothetical protein
VVGHCRITVSGPRTSAIRWLDNAALQATPVNQFMGVYLKLAYTINAGAVSTTRPAIPS